jgi:hypothetical protein
MLDRSGRDRLSTDTKKIGQWVFNHRNDLWAVFSGSARPAANT